MIESAWDLSTMATPPKPERMPIITPRVTIVISNIALSRISTGRSGISRIRSAKRISRCRSTRRSRRRSRRRSSRSARSSARPPTPRKNAARVLYSSCEKMSRPFASVPRKCGFSPVKVGGAGCVGMLTTSPASTVGLSSSRAWVCVDLGGRVGDRPVLDDRELGRDRVVPRHRVVDGRIPDGRHEDGVGDRHRGEEDDQRQPDHPHPVLAEQAPGRRERPAHQAQADLPHRHARQVAAVRQLPNAGAGDLERRAPDSVPGCRGESCHHAHAMRILGSRTA